MQVEGLKVLVVVTGGGGLVVVVRQLQALEMRYRIRVLVGRLGLSWMRDLWAGDLPRGRRSRCRLGLFWCWRRGWSANFIGDCGGSRYAYWVLRYCLQKLAELVC